MDMRTSTMFDVVDGVTILDPDAVPDSVASASLAPVLEESERAVLAMLDDIEYGFVAQRVADDLEVAADWADLAGKPSAGIRALAGQVRDGRIAPQPPLPDC